jgi:hypothetical protein
MQTPERPIGPGLRLLLGVIGTVALIATIIIITAEVGALRTGASFVAALLIGFGIAIIAGGVLLIRGAIRGRIRFRKPRR